MTLWTVARQALLSVGFSRREYWSGLSCSPPEDLPNPGTEPVSLTSSALAGGFFTTYWSHLGSPDLGGGIKKDAGDTKGCSCIGRSPVLLPLPTGSFTRQPPPQGHPSSWHFQPGGRNSCSVDVLRAECYPCMRVPATHCQEAPCRCLRPAVPLSFRLSAHPLCVQCFPG